MSSLKIFKEQDKKQASGPTRKKILKTVWDTKSLKNTRMGYFNYSSQFQNEIYL